MAINKTTTETKNKIKANSVIALPNRPQIPAEQLKQAFVKPIVDTSNSMIQELDRIVEETNAELEQVQVDITNAIDEHNTDTEATHLDIRQSIDTINGTLSEHDFRINELEDFASNLEIDITEEIEQALSGKADLVDGKVPLEQLPDVEDVLTGDITSHNHATEIGNHNSSGTSHSDIRTAINNLQSAMTTIQNIIGTVGEDDENEVIDKLQEVFKVLEDFEEDSNLVSILANKVDIDDLPIVIGYLSSGVFYKDSGLTQAITGSTSKIYIDIKENNKKIYWFNGTVYEEISKPLSLGTGSNQAYYGDLGNTAYLHSQSAHAPSNAQKNSDITKAEIEAKLTGEISSHSHALPTHNHDSDYYKKSETYSKAQTDALVGNLQGQTQELKSITTQPTGTFTYGDQYYNSTTKGLYYWNGSAWELTGAGEPIAGVIYSFNGTLYFWNETEADLIQIGGGVDLSNYYSKTEIDAMFDNLLGGEY